MSRVRPTGLGVKGLAFYAVLVGAYLASPYFNLFFLLLTFVTVLGLLNLLCNITNLRGATGGFDEPEPVAAETEGDLAGWLDDGGKPRFALRLELDVEGAGKVVLPVKAR